MLKFQTEVLSIWEAVIHVIKVINLDIFMPLSEIGVAVGIAEVGLETYLERQGHLPLCSEIRVNDFSFPWEVFSVSNKSPQYLFHLILLLYLWKGIICRKP